MDMYINQGQFTNEEMEVFDTRCGAFCITYWDWMNRNEQIPESKEYDSNLEEQQNSNVKNFLNNLNTNYETVKFQSEDINILIKEIINLSSLNDVEKKNVEQAMNVVMQMFENFSNPIKMLSHLNTLCEELDFNVKLQTINEKLSSLLAKLAEGNTNIKEEQIVYNKEIDNLAEGEYAILIFGAEMKMLQNPLTFSENDKNVLETILKNMGGLMPMHYVLVRGNKNGLDILDPADGILAQYGNNLSGLNKISAYQNMYTTIYLKKVV